MKNHHVSVCRFTRVLLFLFALASLLWCPPAAGAVTLTAGNDIYRIHILADEAGAGMYTATTGPGHPVGSGLDVLYGDGEPGTSFNTIRSYTSGLDYVMGPVGWYYSPTPYRSLDLYATVTPIGTEGFLTEYVLPGPPDRLTIRSFVVVHGVTYGESTIEIRTTVINNNDDTVEIGVRYLFDFQIGKLFLAPDDGPVFQQINPDGPVLTFETEFVSPAFESYLIVDNDRNPAPPTFFILGTVNGPAALNPTAPDLLQYTCWPESSYSVFEYAVDPALEIATLNAPCSGPSGGDTAVLSYFGGTDAEAIRLFEGEELTISSSLFLTPPVSRELLLDVKPGSCVNPLNTGSRGVTPMALVGIDGFDLAEVDPASLLIEGLPATSASVEDVSSPGDLMDNSEGCAGGPDGMPDLTVKFDTPLMVNSLERKLGRPLMDGEEFVLTVLGNFKEEFGGGSFQARDTVRIISKSKKK